MINSVSARRLADVAEQHADQGYVLVKGLLNRGNAADLRELTRPTDPAQLWQVWRGPRAPTRTAARGRRPPRLLVERIDGQDQSGALGQDLRYALVRVIPVDQEP
jgi:hypothetical protein